MALGGAADEVRERVDLTGVDVVLNPDFGDGCATSIRSALAAVRDDADGVVLLLGDQPGVTAETVEALVAGAGGHAVGVCAYDDGLGHPLWFDRSMFDVLAGLHGDKAVWKLVDADDDVVRVPVAGRIPRDVDTWEDYQALLEAADERRPRRPPRRCAGASTTTATSPTRGMATAVFLTLRLGLPLLLEGEPGVGKTAAAQVLARALDAPLVRLQCYEGLTASEALYDWNHQRQLLAIRLAESQHQRIGEADLFSEEFLVERPILRCIRYDGPRPPVLLIDEVDRADDEFEALLLEALGEGSVTVPELGTFTAMRPPIVVLTSNRSRDLHDALRRRCLYHWLEYPEPERVVAILRRTAPSANLAADRVGRPVRRPRPRARRGQAARGGRGDQLGRGALRAGRHRAGARRWWCRRSARSPRPPTTATWWSRRSRPTRSAERDRRPTGPARCWRASTGRPSSVALGQRLRAAGVPVTLTRDVRLHRGARRGAAHGRCARSTGWPGSPWSTASRTSSCSTGSSRRSSATRCWPSTRTPGAGARRHRGRSGRRRARSGRRRRPRRGGARPPTCPGTPCRGSAADDDAAPDARSLPELLPSAVARIADTPLDELDEAELAVLGRWLEESAPRWPTRRSRRQRVRPTGHRVALRETIAASRRTGWEPMELQRYHPVRRPLTVTLLCDVSQSMQSHATAYLHLMRAFARTRQRRDVRVLDLADPADPGAVAPRSAAAAVAHGRGAGRRPVRRHPPGRRCLRELLASRHGNAVRGGVLVIASDGWDSDDPADLAAVMARARRRARRVVWLNPRAAAPGLRAAGRLDGGGAAVLRRLPARPHPAGAARGLRRDRGRRVSSRG